MNLETKRQSCLWSSLRHCQVTAILEIDQPHKLPVNCELCFITKKNDLYVSNGTTDIRRTYIVVKIRFFHITCFIWLISPSKTHFRFFIIHHSSSSPSWHHIVNTTLLFRVKKSKGMMNEWVRVYYFMMVSIISWWLITGHRRANRWWDGWLDDGSFPHTKNNNNHKLSQKITQRIKSYIK